jgi:hypothetical protein
MSTDDCNHTPFILINPVNGTCLVMILLLVQKYDVQQVLVMILLLQVWLSLLALMKLRSEICCQYQSGTLNKILFLCLNRFNLEC